MREMKNSGVAWIGEIPKDWSLVRFKDKYKNVKEIAKEQSANYERLALTLGGVIKRPKDDSDGLQPKEFDSYQILRENDFVFKMIDLQNVSTSRVGLSPYTGLVSPAYIRFTPKNEGQYSQFVYYYLMCLYYNQVFNNLGGNGVRSALSAKDMGEFVIPFPDAAEQKKICALLDEKFAHVDSLIANVQAQIEKLKAYKQSLITEVVTKGLDPNAPMKDSGVDWIGQVPMHWHIVKLKYITEISRGLFNHRPRNDPSLYGGKYPFIQTGDVARAQKFITSYSQTLNERGKEVSKLFPKGTMTMTIAANVGDVAILGFDAYFPDSVVGFTVRKDYNEDYVYYLFQALKESFIRASIVSTQLNLNIERSKEILAPTTYNICEQKAIADFLNDRCSQIEQLISLKESKIEKLQQYKRSLIYEYVTGKKEVV